MNREKIEVFSYKGRRWPRWAKALLALIGAGILSFAILLGLVLTGSYDHISGNPRVMIILGCQVRQDGPSILLRDRLDEALSYLEDHPDMTVVVSGGQGPDEPMSEAQCMYDYLTAHGVDGGRIVLEDRSSSTWENIRYTLELFQNGTVEPTGKILAVSNGFHLSRIRLLWSREWEGTYTLSTLAAPSSHLPSGSPWPWPNPGCWTGEHKTQHEEHAMLEEKLKALEHQYAELEARLAAPETYGDPARVARLNKEQRELEPVVTTYRAWVRRRQDLQEAEGLLSDPDMKELAQEEYASAKADLESLEERLKILLLPRDPNDGKNVIMEIRAGVGGEEAALFAHSLFRMYSMYAESRHWHVEVDSVNETELGGIKEICFTIDGDGAYSRLKFESGVHRVQRVPETESGGRIHTSTATVAVLPEMEEVDVQLNPADVEMQVFRSSGAGGQHINKTSSAVRLIHKPTGTVVECQQERSQFQNRDKAMQLLRSRLYEEKVREQEESVTAERRSQVGTGMRNERIRTYNFPQGRVTDHRIGLTLYQIDAIMDGELDEVIDGLVTADQAERMKASQEE